MTSLEAEEAYETLMELARTRRITWEPFKYETHHVLPRCMGGTEDKVNLVLLRIKEHLRAHKLLALMHPNLFDVVETYRAMLKNLGEDFKDETDVEKEARFEKVRIGAAKKISEIHKGRKKSPEEIENIRQARITAEPRKFSDTAKSNMSVARKKTWEERKVNGTDKEIAAKTVATRRANGSYVQNDKQREQAKINFSGEPWNKGKKGVISEETRLKMRLAKLGKPSNSKGSTGKPPWNKGKIGVSDETRAKMRASRLRCLENLKSEDIQDGFIQRPDYSDVHTYCRGGNASSVDGGSASRL